MTDALDLAEAIRERVRATQNAHNHPECDEGHYDPVEGVVCACGEVLGAVVPIEHDEIPDDVMEQAGRELIEQRGDDARVTRRSVEPLDPTGVYGPADVERRIADATRRLEYGAVHEANLIAAYEQAAIVYELAYARAIAAQDSGAADVRKARAMLACEREYLDMRNAKAAAAAMKAVLHTLRSVQSGYQSVAKSVAGAYAGHRGEGN